MTVHKAKGLEFPVVILADLTCRMSRAEASRYLDASERLCAMKIGGWAPHELHEHEDVEVRRDEAEGVRLAYVAATRARDLLVVPALGDEPWDGGWLNPLNRALYPPIATRRTATRGPKCPPFKSKDSVLLRPHDARARGASASVSVQTVNEWVTTVESVRGRQEGQESVSIVNLGAGGVRPGGLDFGALVHEIMAQAPFDASPEIVDNIAAVQAQLLAMTDEDARAAAAVVSRLLAHDLLSRARAADARGPCRRETPVTCTTADRALVEGVVDLAFEASGLWTVVDYKTDREFATEGEDRYRRQVALYATAIARATGRPARGVLVRV